MAQEIKLSVYLKENCIINSVSIEILVYSRCIFIILVVVTERHCQNIYSQALLLEPKKEESTGIFSHFSTVFNEVMRNPMQKKWR